MKYATIAAALVRCGLTIAGTSGMVISDDAATQITAGVTALVGILWDVLRSSKNVNKL
jgi:hypothetical protein